MSATADPIEIRRLAWLLGVILFLGSAYFYQDPEWNGNSRLDLTRAIVEQGSVRIDSYHEAPGWETGDKAFFNGHYYSDKAIGSSLMAVPIYFIIHIASKVLGLGLDGTLIKHVLTTSVMGAMFALSGLCMFFVALRITGRPWKAAVPTLALCFGTMMWPYSAVFYGHLPAAAFLALTFALLFRISESEFLGTPGTWFWIGLGTSMAFLSDHTSALVIVGLAVYALYALRKLDVLTKVRITWSTWPGLLIPLLFFFAYNMSVYGRPVAFGYAYEVEERFQAIMGLGVMGIRLPTLGASYHITFDPKFGVFWLSPVLLLAPMGYFLAFKNKTHRAECILSIFAIGIMFAMNAASYLWYGGNAFGPRLVIPALPFFIVPLALLPDAWGWSVAALGIVSAANMLIPLLGQIQYTRLEFRPQRGGFWVAEAPFHGFSLLYAYGLDQVFALARSGRSPWTLGSALGFPLWLSTIALLAVESGLLWRFRRLTMKPHPAGRGRPAQRFLDN